MLSLQTKLYCFVFLCFSAKNTFAEQISVCLQCLLHYIVRLTVFTSTTSLTSKQHHIRVLQLVTVAETFLVLNRTLFIRVHKEPYLGRAI